MGATNDYVLGHGDRELARLAAQADFYRPLTENVLRSAGLCEGMRVLDVGTGVGDVAFLAAELVGARGEVVGIDRAPEPLERARRRLASAGLANVRFEQADLESYTPERPVDAIVGRLVLMYQRDPAMALRGLVRHLRPGGIVAFQELHIAARGCAFPPLPLFDTMWSWVLAACERGGLPLEFGMRLVPLFRDAGLEDAGGILGGRLGTRGDSGATTIAVETTRSLAPLIERFGIATAEELGLDTLRERLAAEIDARGAVMSPALLVGAWARKPR